MRNVLKAGTMITGVMTTLFAFIQFIPYDSTLLFAVAGFGVRLLLAVGTSAVFTATLALATTIFPEQSVWVLVCPLTNLLLHSFCIHRNCPSPHQDSNHRPTACKLVR